MSESILNFVKAAAGSRPDNQAARIVCFGDSITATRGPLDVYAQRLQRWLTEQSVAAKVINAGVGGHNTDHARERFARDVLEHEPDLVVILFGANDAAVDVWKDPPATLPRVSRDSYRRNIRFFVEQLRQRGALVILMAPTPYRWTPKMKALYGKPPYNPDDPEGFSIHIRKYAQTIRDLAVDQQLPMVDLYQAFQAWAAGESGRSLDDLYLDGMHPNDIGQAVIFAALRDKLCQPLRRCGCERSQPGSLEA